MKKLNYAVLLFVTTLLISCGGSDTKKGDGPTGSKSENSKSSESKKGMDVDYAFLENPVELKKLLEDVKSKMGDNQSKTDEFTVHISRPSKEGMVKREGEPDYFNADYVYQSTKDPNKVMQRSFSSENGWGEVEEKEIQVIIGDAETFKLSDELFDFTKITPELLSKVIADGKNSFDASKFEYVYCYYLKVNKEGIDASYKGKLKANGVEKTESYRTDLSGNKR